MANHYDAHRHNGPSPPDWTNCLKCIANRFDAYAARQSWTNDKCFLINCRFVHLMSERWLCHSVAFGHSTNKMTIRYSSQMKFFIFLVRGESTEMHDAVVGATRRSVCIRYSTNWAKNLNKQSRTRSVESSYLCEDLSTWRTGKSGRSDSLPELDAVSLCVCGMWVLIIMSSFVRFCTVISISSVVQQFIIRMTQILTFLPNSDPLTRTTHTDTHKHNDQRKKRNIISCGSTTLRPASAYKVES